MPGCPCLCLWSPLSIFKAISMLCLCLYRWKGLIESQIPLAAACVHSYYVFKYYRVRFQPTTLIEGTLKIEFLQKKVVSVKLKRRNLVECPRNSFLYNIHTDHERQSFKKSSFVNMTLYSKSSEAIQTFTFC